MSNKILERLEQKRDFHIMKANKLQDRIDRLNEKREQNKEFPNADSRIIQEKPAGEAYKAE